jgi:hypothetical protein
MSAPFSLRPPDVFLGAALVPSAAWPVFIRVSLVSRQKLAKLALPNQLEVTCSRARPDDPTLRARDGPAVAFERPALDHKRGGDGELAAIRGHENSRGLQRALGRHDTKRRINRAFAGDGSHPD